MKITTHKADYDKKPLIKDVVICQLEKMIVDVSHLDIDSSSTLKFLGDLSTTLSAFAQCVTSVHVGQEFIYRGKPWRVRFVRGFRAFAVPVDGRLGCWFDFEEII